MAHKLEFVLIRVKKTPENEVINSKASHIFTFIQAVDPVV
jgi:hypothetical protein